MPFMSICSSRLQLAQRNGRATRENPESWIHCFSKGEHKGVEGICQVCNVIERSSALLTIQQHTYTLWIGIDQHSFTAVIPSGQLDVKPLNAPGLCIAAQPTSGTFAVNATVSQAYANEIVAAESNFPVVAPSGETLGGEHLRADSEAFRGIWVVYVLI